MSDKCVINKSTLKNIADAIRTKCGTTDKMSVQQMTANIAAIVDKRVNEIVSRTITKLYDDDMTSIGNCAFLVCTELTTVSLPSARSISDNAFEYCTSLTTVSLPSATSIGAEAFGYCDALTSVSFTAAKSISDYAFEFCTSLTTVSLPAATSIGESVFYDCDALTTVSLPAATSIGYNAFFSCGALTELTLTSFTKNQMEELAIDCSIPSGQNITVHCSDGDLVIE